MPNATKSQAASGKMLTWQLRKLTGQLMLLQEHSTDESCPCEQGETQEFCIPKHLLHIQTLSEETIPMTDDNQLRALLDRIAGGANDLRRGYEEAAPEKRPYAEIAEFARGRRKELEPSIFTYKKAVATMRQEPKVRISGSCAQGTCSLKVKGAIETTQTTSPSRLSETIDEVVRHLGQRADGKASPLTYALGPTSLTRYELKYRIMKADAIIPSNDPMSFQPNPEYPQNLQPRLRGRAANKAQVLMMAARLDPDALLDDFHSIDRGAPIVNAEGVVLSGNGRVMAIQHAIKENPESYAVYKEHIAQAAKTYGLKAPAGEQPVLVRELVSKVDPRDFVEEANASTTIAASAIEVARSDAQKITATMINSLEVAEGQGMEDALRSGANAAFVSSFLSKLPANERAGIADAKGTLNQDGLRRITMAIFVNVFPGDVGIRLAEKFFESTDVNVRNVFNGLVAALGKLAQAEALTREGNRDKELAIGDDLARSVVAFSDIKKTPGMTVDKYLAQGQMFERQLNDFQERLLAELDTRSRSGRKIAALLKAYADAVIDSPPPSQGALIPGAGLTKDQALDLAIKHSEEPQAAAMFQDHAPKWCPSMNTAARELDKAIKNVGASRARLAALRDKLQPSLNICRGQALMIQPNICQFMRGAVKEEQDAGAKYRSAAFAAREEGMPDADKTLTMIAGAEDRHLAAIRGLVEDNCREASLEQESCDLIPARYRYLTALFGADSQDYVFSDSGKAAGKIDQALAKLEKGVQDIQDSGKFRDFLNTLAKFHHYSLGNMILISFQKPDATMVAGFNRWREMGRFVKRGQQGIMILAPCFPPKGKPEKKEEPEEPGKKEELEEGQEAVTDIAPVFFKVVYVFDIAQTEGKEIPSVEVPILEGEATGPLYARLEALAAKLNIHIDRTPQDAGGAMGYWNRRGTIWVKPDVPTDQATKTLIHELAHAICETEHCGGPGVDAETIAESVAYCVGQHFGFDSGLRSFPYVATWGKDIKVLKRNMDKIRQVSSKVIDSLETAEMAARPRCKPVKDFVHCRLAPKGHFDPASFRTVTPRDGVRITTGCQRGHYHGSHCDTGTEAQRIMYRQDICSSEPGCLAGTG